MDRLSKRILRCIAILAVLGLMTYDSLYISKANELQNKGIAANSNQEEAEVVNEIETVIEEVVPPCTEEVIYGDMTEETGADTEPDSEVETQTAIEGAETEETYIVQTSYDKSIFVENGLEFHYIAGDTWQGLMTIVKDPSRVFVGMPRDNYTGAAGANSGFIAHRYGAIYAVNGAFFQDTNYSGNGGTPIGFVFSEGRQTAGGTGQAFNLMGLDNNNQFVCEKMTGAQAIERGIRDAVTCNPILVQNGQIADLRSKNVTLMDARTAVGAREDGAILLLTVDGRMAHSIGAKTVDIAQCMIDFGAISAGNLDGGGSVSIYYAGTPIEGLSTLLGARPVPNAFCVRPE